MTTIPAEKKQELHERVTAAIASERQHLVDVGETIRQNPEYQFEEVMASQLLTDQLREAGLEVEKPFCGMETAFRATLRSGRPGPTVAIIAEYDALRGIGHGCGHNLIAASGLAAGIGIAEVIDEINGNLVIIGSPAEEGGGGKIYELNEGGFDGVDAALMIHHAGNQTGAPLEWPDGTCLATTGFEFEYFGAPAHSANDPENGVNALNAVIHLFTGIDAYRQHIRMESRIHGIITHGGEAANVVPKYAAAQISIRAASLEILDEQVERVKAIAEGAALMTGCEMKITRHREPYLDKRPSYVIGEIYRDNMEEVGLDLSNPPKGRGMHSTDFGNVSYKLPVVTGSFAISHDPIPGHSQEVVDASGSEFGYDQCMKVSTAMALTALDIMINPELSAKAWDEHQNWSDLYER